MTGKQIRNYAVILAVLVVLVLVLERPFGGGGQSSGPQPFGKLDVSAVDRIRVTKADDDVTELVRADGGAWLIDRDYPLPADTASVRLALESILELTETPPVSSNPEKYGVFGVDEALGARVDLFAGSDDAVATLVLGKNPRSSGGTYYRFESGDEVYQSAQPMRSYFVKNLLGWKNRKVFTGDPAEIVKFTIERGDSTIVFETDETRRWFLRQPEAFEVSTEEVTGMLRHMVQLTANGLPDTLVTVAESGLDSPQVVARAETIDGRSYELAIGGTTPSGMYYCSPADREWTYLIAKYRVDPLYKDLYSLRVEPAPADTTAGAASTGGS